MDVQSLSRCSVPDVLVVLVQTHNACCTFVIDPSLSFVLNFPKT